MLPLLQKTARVTPLLLLLSAAAGGAAVVSACDDGNVYIYSAARYDEAADCIQPYESIDLLPGEGASARCSPRCLQIEGAIYVSTVCPPLPEGVELLPPDSAVCVAAFRSYGRDGGTCAEPVGDAETSSDGGDEGDGGDSPDGGGPGVPDASEPIRDAAVDG